MINSSGIPSTGLIIAGNIDAATAGVLGRSQLSYLLDTFVRATLQAQLCGCVVLPLFIDAPFRSYAVYFSVRYSCGFLLRKSRLLSSLTVAPDRF